MAHHHATDTWLAQVERDLKGRPAEDLHWSLSERIAVNPFVTTDDLATTPTPLSDRPVGWQIAERFDLGASDTNALILDALQNGTEGIILNCADTPTSAQLSNALEGVYLDFVGIHFEGAGIMANPGAALAALLTVAKERGIAADALRGSLRYDPLAQEGLRDWRYLADLIAFGAEQAPHMRLITIAESDHTDTPEVALAHLIRRGQQYVSKLREHHISAGALAPLIQLEVAVGTHYLVEVARLRALQVLWLNLLKAHDAPLTAPVIAARFAQSAYTDDLYTNMISATTMAMSAVLGGATRLEVRPYDDGRADQSAYAPAFGRRIARNVQHLLKMESGFDQLADPAAGSAYIETLTQQLATTAWALAGA
jgi:methylmalonyl-CoA mutase